MPVYIDVLLIINGFVNYLIILCTIKMLRLKTHRIRLLLSTVISSLFSLEIFLPYLGFLGELCLRIFMCLIISIILFKQHSLSAFLKSSLTLLFVSTLFGGIISAIIMVSKSNMIVYNNGAIYYNISFFSLAVLSTAAFMLITVLEKIIAKKSSKSSIYQVTVINQGLSCSGRGFIDTGNTLREVFSSSPVIIAEHSVVKSITPDGIEMYFNKEIPDTANAQIRMIPISTLNATSLLPAFKADEVILKGAGGTYINKDIYVALSKKELCSGEYEFILNTALTEEWHNEKNKSTAKKAFSFN